MYFIGVHQDSAVQSAISLPLIRLIGVVKLRIAQINTTIGVIRNNIKNLDPTIDGVSGGPSMGEASKDSQAA